MTDTKASSAPSASACHKNFGNLSLCVGHVTSFAHIYIETLEILASPA